MSGLDQRGHGNRIKPSRPLPRPQPSPQATSTPPPPLGSQQRKVALLLSRGEQVRVLFTSTCGLCSLGTLPPEASQQQAACQSQQNQECSRAGTPGPQALCPGDPGMQTQSRLPAFAQPSAIGRLQSPADIYPAIAHANFLQLTHSWLGNCSWQPPPTPSSQKLPPTAPTLGDLRGGVYSGVLAS